MYLGQLQKQKVLGWGLYMLWKMTQLFSSVGADNMMGQEQELTLSWKDIHYSYYSALSWKTINEYE